MSSIGSNFDSGETQKQSIDRHLLLKKAKKVMEAWERNKRKKMKKEKLDLYKYRWLRMQRKEVKNLQLKLLFSRILLNGNALYPHSS